MINVTRLVSNLLDCNCYIISQDNDCIIIDPAVEYGRIKEHIIGKKIKAVLITHCHYDHIIELESYLNCDCIFYMHKKCYNKLTDPLLNASKYLGIDHHFNIPNEKVKFVFDNIKLDILTDTTIKVITTPGHTDCSVCFLIEDYMFSGDTVFCRSIGRTDFETGDELEMAKSIKRISDLKVNYTIMPGHDQYTTLEEEKIYNKYFRKILR